MVIEFVSGSQLSNRTLVECLCYISAPFAVCALENTKVCSTPVIMSLKSWPDRNAADRLGGQELFAKEESLSGERLLSELVFGSRFLDYCLALACLDAAASAGLGVP